MPSLYEKYTTILTQHNATRILADLHASGELKTDLPEVSGLDSPAKKGFQHKDMFAHTLQVVDNVNSDDVILRWAALLHDIGKPATRKYTTDGGVTFDGHEVVGGYMVASLAKRIGMPDNVAVPVRLLVRLHIRARNVESWTNSGIRRYAHDAGDQVARLNLLVRADVTSKHQWKREKVYKMMDLLDTRLGEVIQNDLKAAVRPPIDGNEVAVYLNLKPGPKLGEIMRMLTSKAREDSSFTKEDAYLELDSWDPEKIGKERL